VTRRAGIAKHVSPHAEARIHHSRAWMPVAPLRDVQEAASHAEPRATPTPPERAGNGQPGPPCDLHRRHLHRRGSALALQAGPGRQPGRPWPGCRDRGLSRSAHRTRQQRSRTRLTCATVRCAIDSPEVNAEKVSALRFERPLEASRNPSRRALRLRLPLNDHAERVVTDRFN
jgi:hypothetical protein